MKNKNDVEQQLLLFGMKNLFAEIDLNKLEESGVEINHIETLKKDKVVDTELFEHVILRKANIMADFYALYFSLENSVRKLLRDVLSEKYGSNWWKEKVPKGIQDNVKKIQKEEKESAMSIRSEDPLDYTNFGELIGIFEANWQDFSDQFRSLKSIKDTLSPLNKIRNIIAHSCELNEDEILRFTLLIKDWFRIQD